MPCPRASRSISRRSQPPPRTSCAPPASARAPWVPGGAPPAAAPLGRPAGARVPPTPRPAGVRGERRLLERLAANLIENGVRYNAPGGFVAVSTRAAPDGAVLDVINSGPPVDPAVAARLTEPFERGGRTGTRGAGLGLSIVRAVAEAHVGRLTLTPRPEGGLAVRVDIPRM